MLADADWTSLLTLAIAHGWKPEGTEGPPSPFGMAGETSGQPSWEGRYDDAAGQLVRCDDARRMGEALRGAVRAGDPAVDRFREVILVLISWTTSGGFIICRETPADTTSPRRVDQKVWYRAA